MSTFLISAVGRDIANLFLRLVLTFAPDFFCLTCLVLLQFALG